MSSILDQAEFAENPEPRCPVVLLLDTSGSMEGKSLDEVNQGLRMLSTDLKQDTLAALRVELAIVTCGGHVSALRSIDGRTERVASDAVQTFMTADQFEAPALVAAGDTPLGEAARVSLQLLRDRKAIYRTQGVDYFRPWLFIMTDGQPTDLNWEAAAAELRAEEERKGVLVFPVGVEGANVSALSRFSVRQPLMLKSLSSSPGAFREYFSWVSKSLSSIAQSRPGDQLALPPVDWANVQV